MVNSNIHKVWLCMVLAALLALAPGAWAQKKASTPKPKSASSTASTAKKTAKPKPTPEKATPKKKKTEDDSDSEDAKAAESGEPEASGLPDGKGKLVAHSAIVIDALTGQPIFEKNADDRLYPASTTKIVTALVIIEAGNLDGEVTIEEPETRAEPSKLYVKVGEKYTRREMLYALLLKSANDIAEALARDNAGSVAAFGEKMTKRARELGATGSNFANPHGLPNRDHYTTVHDMAVIARAGMQQPLFRKIVGTVSHPWVGASGVQQLTNHNRLLKRFPGCTGLKTGWTQASKHTLVSAAMRDNREVIAVVFKTVKPNVWDESERLLNYGLGNLPALPSQVILTDAGKPLKTQN